MRTRSKKVCVLLLSAVCCLAVLGGCGSMGPSDEGSAGDRSAKEASKPQAGQEAEGAEEADASEGSEKEPVSLGEFSMEDIYGEAYTQEMFADYKLTMVNVFATWCSPCIKEIPDLEALKNEVAGQEVNLVGIVLDAVDEKGGADPEAVEKAQALAEQIGVTYPFLVPDAGYLNGLLMGVSAVPTTFFVDSEGNLVGEVYMGSRSLEEWRSVVETELEGVSQ